MAVAMSGTDRVDYGDIAATSGLTEFSVALTIKFAAAPSDLRLVTQWSAAWLAQVTDTNEVGFVIDGVNGSFFGQKTTALNVANGETHRIVMTWKHPTSTDIIEIWSNGTK
ncbi:hypothetical protein LCGC14_3084070, partial [marine sediment metagenome]